MILLNSKTLILVAIFVKLVYANMDSKDGKSSFTKLLKNLVDVNEKRVVAMKELSQLQDFIYTKNSLSKIHDNEFNEDSTEILRDGRSVLSFVSLRKNLNLSLRRTYSTNNKKSDNFNIPFSSLNNKKGIKHLNINRNKYKLNVNFNRDVDEETMRIETQKKDKDGINNKYISKKYTKVDSAKENKQNKKYEDRIKSISYRRSKCDTKETKLCRRACDKAHRNGCLKYKCTRKAKKAFSKECKLSCRDVFMARQYSDSEEE